MKETRTQPDTRAARARRLATAAATAPPDARDPFSTLSAAQLRRTLPWDGPDAPDWAPLVEREWLVTNGLGGYAAGTVCGASTRRYHGLLIAAEPPPLGRILALEDVIVTVELAGGTRVQLGGEERPERLELHGARYLREFRLEWGLPTWRYRIEGVELEKRLAMLWGTNTTVMEFRLPGGGPVALEVRPTARLRSHDMAVDAPLEPGYRLEREAEGVRVTGVEGLPDLRMRIGGAPVSFHEDVQVLPEFLYRVEASRGYGSVGDTWSPGFWRTEVDGERTLALVASTHPWVDVPLAETVPELFEAERNRRKRLVDIAHPSAHEGAAAELVLAADQFIIQPVRGDDEKGQPACSIIAGYHWFTDWGRDTMISLEGLTLLTGREEEARAILQTFAGYTRDGLIPNHFPEGDDEGVYHTADATLWFFHAVDRYLDWTGDRDTLRGLMPTLRAIVEAHRRGTRFNIGVDPADGLLRQGAEGYQLTWMDAKVDDWVVTPRRGKAVEINALWYNALRLMEGWEEAVGERSRANEVGELAEAVRDAFNRRFWIEEAGHLYDVVDGEDGDDDAFRPNQIFAVSLRHPVLEESRWERVVEAVRDRLLTPVGLRSLSREHPDYRRTYLGNLWERDGAYHQGTVWAWLIGPFVDAWLRVHPERGEDARGFLQGLLDHLDEFCIGSVAEIFDAEEPHRPRGCVAQAWSVAELLRCLVLTEAVASDRGSVEDRPLQWTAEGAHPEERT